MPHRAALILLVLPLLAGCGTLRPVQISPVALSGPEARFETLPESLGVAELVDRRPRSEKRGRKPWLIPLIVWNQRMGTYVTSSEHLGGDVAGDVSRAVARALSGWRFGRGRVIEGDAAGACDADDLEYLASGEIQHLYGSVRQRAWLFIFPFGILGGNQVGDAVGVVRLSLRIRDCRSGEEILSRSFVSEDLYPRMSPSAAAQRAFDALMRDVAELGKEPMRNLPEVDDAGDEKGAETEPPDAPRPPSLREPKPAPRQPDPPVEEDGEEPVLTPL